MEITKKNVAEILSQLADQIIEREDAQSWAIGIRDALDDRRLVFVPVSDKTTIWDAIQFIELYAEKIAPETYLYSMADLENYMIANFWKAEGESTDR